MCSDGRCKGDVPCDKIVFFQYSIDMRKLHSSHVSISIVVSISQFLVTASVYLQGLKIFAPWERVAYEEDCLEPPFILNFMS